ncbi:hypothetical protein F6455_17355 [Proteobacteria bacterium 005FR1]|nr:hypothetical protein [Proteobacteria bacterium 005FR1]
MKEADCCKFATSQVLDNQAMAYRWSLCCCQAATGWRQKNQRKMKTIGKTASYADGITSAKGRASDKKSLGQLVQAMLVLDGNDGLFF